MSDSDNLDEPKKRPASQYYWGDWLKDQAVKSCPLIARGLWHEMNCIMHQCEPYGHLYRNGKPMTAAQLATLVSIPERQCKALLDELEDAGVFSRDGHGAIFSRRMVRDEVARELRAKVGRENGEKGAEHGAKGAEHGGKGGRPRKATPLATTGAETPPPQPGQKPPYNPLPSSSSSSSTSVEEIPLTPVGGKPGPVSLKAWVETVKARGETLIPPDDPVFAYADEIALPREFLHLAWREFRTRHGDGSKRYRDWRAVFRRAVRGNWLKLWYLVADQYQLTTVGLQAQRAHAVKEAA